MATSVRTATQADRPVIENLIQLYLHDMTGTQPFPIGLDGKFQYDFLDRFWQHPYLIFSDDDLAGFAFVIDGSPLMENPDRHFMAEFFVLKGYRKKGVGRAAFDEILSRHNGLWQIGVPHKNPGGTAFWAKATQGHAPTKSAHKFDGENWMIYDFEVGQ